MITKSISLRAGAFLSAAVLGAAMLAACSSSAKSSSGTPSTSAAGAPQGSSAGSSGGTSSTSAGAPQASSAGSSGGTSSTSAGAPQGQATKVTVMVPPNHPPTSYTQNGNLVGQWIDIINAVAKRANWDATFVQVPFATEIPSLQSGKYDIGTSLSLTVAREKLIDLVSLEADGFTMLAKGLTFGNSLTDLCGLKVGTDSGGADIPLIQAASTQCGPAGKKPIALSVFPDQSSSVLALTSGRIQVMVHNPSAISLIIQANPGLGLKMSGVIFGRSLTGFGFKTGSSLALQFQNAINAMIKDGSYHTIMAKWGLSSLEISSSEVNPTNPALPDAYPTGS